MDSPLHVVTGAFGFSGQYIARRLLDKGYAVRTLTNSPERENPLRGRVVAMPYQFDDPAGLAKSLEGASVLYNTYWVRFNYPGATQSAAVENTLRLFAAAKTAGVPRIVHVSITNPAEDSPLEYFRQKARLERALIESGLSYAILRPAILFGEEDILINNIAWTLRRLPVFGIFGRGQYRLRPIYVDDLAQLAVEQGDLRDDVVLNAVGPETFTYRELVAQIGRIIGCRRPIIPTPPAIAYLAATVLGKLLGDVIVTREEISGLMAGLLWVDGPPAGQTKLTDWVREHAAMLGRRYASELARRTNRKAGYGRI